MPPLFCGKRGDKLNGLEAAGFPLVNRGVCIHVVRSAACADPGRGEERAAIDAEELSVFPARYRKVLPGVELTFAPPKEQERNVAVSPVHVGWLAGFILSELGDCEDKLSIELEGLYGASTGRMQALVKRQRSRFGIGAVVRMIHGAAPGVRISVRSG